ncbi:serine hydrolase domain-containing protein [Gorillibacterium sp. CAU 1737]|uniref:serine hydrolase domain-containing protein n=1 Tax=Gorillibacterium sp. CAU 1737 TaxID=3140362 RepID=UPI0032601E4E
MNRSKAWIPLFLTGFLLTTALIPVLPGKVAAEESLTPARLEETVDAVVQKAMTKEHIPGTAVVVTQGDQILFKKGYGYADLETKTPMDPERTVIPVGSLTKSLTASALLQLKEEGLVSMEQDVNTYLKAFQIPDNPQQPIALKHLLTHTAGLDEALYGIIADSPSKTTSLGKYLKRYFNQQPPVRSPGIEYAYSNAGLGLAAFILEEVTGTPLGDYFAKKLFEPLDMPSAALNAPESPEMARSYAFADDRYTRLPYSYVNLPGAGGLSLIPTEWSHFMMALLNDGVYQGKRILNADSVKEMQARHFSEHPDLEGVGYGLFRTRLKNGLLTYWHNGDVDGFSARMELIPAHKLGILVVSNAASPGIPLQQKVTDVIASLLPESHNQTAQSRESTDSQQLQPDESTGGPLVQRSDLSADSLSPYERTYTMSLSPQHGWGKWFRWLGVKDYEISSAQGKLIVRGVFPDGTGVTEDRFFLPVSEGLFQDEASEDTVSFHEKNGRWSMSFTQGVTIPEKPSWWHHPRTAFIAYGAIALSWVGLFLFGVISLLVRLMRRKKPLRLGASAGISCVFTVFLAGQLLYGNSSVFMKGYPAWYAWGFSSVPFLAAIWALLPAIQVLRSRKKGASHWRSRMAISGFMLLLSFLSTAFFFYWNMLSIPYS